MEDILSIEIYLDDIQWDGNTRCNEEILNRFQNIGTGMNQLSNIT